MEESSARNSPNDSRSPTGILKRKPGKQNNVEESVTHVNIRKPFKLRFGKQHDLGRSSVSSTKPPGLLPILTSKFYSKENEAENLRKQSICEIKNNIDLLYCQGPREIFKLPNLESHKYGWYHDVQLTNRDRFDTRFNFGIKNSTMVKYRLMILATDGENKRPAIIKPKN